jgi:hypothetical protein
MEAKQYFSERMWKKLILCAGYSLEKLDFLLAKVVNSTVTVRSNVL